MGGKVYVRLKTEIPVNTNEIPKESIEEVIKFIKELQKKYNCDFTFEIVEYP